VGNNWDTDSDRSGVGSAGAPPFNITFSNNVCDGIGQLNIQECRHLKIIDNTFQDIVSPTGSSNKWALKVFSQEDWVTHTDAEANSDLTAMISGNSFENLDGGAIRTQYTSSVVIVNNSIKNCSRVTAAPDVSFRNIDKRGSQDTFDGNTLLAGDNGTTGVEIHDNATADDARLRWGDNNKITGHATKLLDFSGGADLIDKLEGQQEIIRLDSLSAGASSVDYPLFVAPSKLTLFDVLIMAGADVTQDNTNYLNFTVKARDVDGDNVATIVNNDTQLATGIDINDYSATRLAELITDSDSILNRVTTGETISMEIANVASGQPIVNPVVILRYMRY